MLREVPLFAGLSDEEINILEQRAVVRSYPKNTIIINEGEDALSLYIILSGKTKVFMADEEGKEIILNSQGPGDHFGELSLIDDEPRSASVMTTDKTRLMVITKKSFREDLANYPNIAFVLLRTLVKRVRLLSNNVKSLALMDVYGRLARTLLMLAEERDGKLVIEQKFTQLDIARRIGASREMVAKILKDLTTGGYISIEHKRITINEKLPKAY